MLSELPIGDFPVDLRHRGAEQMGGWEGGPDMKLQPTPLGERSPRRSASMSGFGAEQERRSRTSHPVPVLLEH